MTKAELTESQLWYLRRAMQMAESEGGWMWDDPPTGVDASEDLDALYAAIGGRLIPTANRTLWGDPES